MTTTIILLTIIYALNIIDYIETVYAISFFGAGVEANPIGRFFFENNCAWIMKFIGVPIILTGIGFIIKVDKKQIWAVYLMLIVYLAVVIHNFSELIEMGIF